MSGTLKESALKELSIDTRSKLRGQCRRRGEKYGRARRWKGVLQKHFSRDDATAVVLNLFQLCLPGPAQDRACQYSIMSPHFSQKDYRQLMAAWKNDVPFFPDGGTDKLVASAPLNNFPPMLKQAVLIKLSGPGTFKREGGALVGKGKSQREGRRRIERKEWRMKIHTHTQTCTLLSINKKNNCVFCTVYDEIRASASFSSVSAMCPKFHCEIH